MKAIKNFKFYLVAAIALLLSISAASALVGHPAGEIFPGSFQVGSYIFAGPLTLQGTLDLSNNKITNLAAPVGDNDAVTKAYVDAGAGASTFPGCGDYNVPTAYPDNIERYNIGVAEDNDCNKVDYDSTDTIFFEETISGQNWYYTALPLASEGKWGYTKDGKPFARVDPVEKIQDYDSSSTSPSLYMDVKLNPYDNRTYMAITKVGSDNYRYTYVFYLDEDTNTWTMFGSTYVYRDTSTSYYHYHPYLAFKSDGYVYCGFQRDGGTRYWYVYKSNGGTWSSVMTTSLKVYDSSYPTYMDFDENENLIILYLEYASPYYLESAKWDGSTLTQGTLFDNLNPGDNLILLKNSSNHLTVAYATNYYYLYLRQYDSSSDSWGYTGSDRYEVRYDSSGSSGYLTGGYYLADKYFYAAFDKNDVLWTGFIGRKTFGSKYKYKFWLREYDGTALNHHDEYSITTDLTTDSALYYGIFSFLFNKNNDMMVFMNSDDTNLMINSHQYDKEHNKWVLLSSSPITYSSKYLGWGRGDVFMTSDERTLNYAFVKREESSDNFKIETLNSNSADTSADCIALQGVSSNQASPTTLSCPNGYKIVSSTCIGPDASSYVSAVECYLKSEREMYLKGYSVGPTYVKGSILCCK